MYPAAIALRVSVVVFWKNKSDRHQCTMNVGILWAAKDAAVGFFRARETQAAFLSRIWSRIWNGTAFGLQMRPSQDEAPELTHSCWCRPSTAFMVTSLPDSRTIRPTETAREKPQKHDEEVKASTWPPQIPNQSSDNGTSQNKSTPWRPHCGPI